jgi:hypothetical protein
MMKYDMGGHLACIWFVGSNALRSKGLSGKTTLET